MLDILGRHYGDFNALRQQTRVTQKQEIQKLTDNTPKRQDKNAKKQP